MHFALVFPWWAALLAALAVCALAWLEYRRPLAPLSLPRRATLAALRAVALALLVAFVFRPIIVLPPTGTREAVVPILVDASRSMRLSDADGATRLARSTAIVRSDLLPALAPHFKTEVFRVGDGVAPAAIETLAADGRRSDLAAGVAAVRERYRGQRIAGIVLVSGGGETARQPRDSSPSPDAPPLFAIGVGSAAGPQDREVIGITAGEQRLDHASIDLHIAAVSRGFGRAPFELRLLANGTLVESRRVVPPADGSPVDELFTAAPDPTRATVYTAEIPSDALDRVPENNTRSVLVSPAGRKRRILVIEGAPGFEHSFVTRAWAADPGLEVDSIVRKGKNADGRDTFFIQAAQARAESLAGGFPARREDLFAYDALVVANVEADFFTRAQLTLVADFVGERGGGLLVMGGRSFSERGLAGSPIEAVLPVELSDRRGGILRTSLAPRGAPFKLAVTEEGEAHPIMRLGASPDETRKLWDAVPPLAASAPVGAPRPGATVLAVAAAATGAEHAVVAVQRYGRGRSMVFAGEASWRWKMLMPATDRTFELFWRQAARWLAGAAPDPVAITIPDAAEPGEAIAVDVDARDASFAPVSGASVEGSITGPDGVDRPLPLRPASTPSRWTSSVHLEQPGLYHIRASARRQAADLGSAERWMLVGGTDREMADPRLNDGFLRRLALASGGRYVHASDAARVAEWLRSAASRTAAPERRDLWNEPWAFALLVGALCAEWSLRRWWGLR